MSGLEIALAIIKGTSTAVKLISSIGAHIQEDKRATKLARSAKRKIRDINTIITEHRVAVDKCEQLHSMMRKNITSMDAIIRDLSALRSQVSAKVAPLRVVEAMSTGESLDRIVSRIENLETRIDACCATAVSMLSQKTEMDRMKTFIQQKRSLEVCASEVQVVEAYGDIFHGASHAKMQVNRTELVFVPTLKLSPEDTKTLHDLGDLGSVPIADALVLAGSILCDEFEAGRTSPEEGMRFLELAATLGNPESQYRMGYFKYWQDDYSSATEHAFVAYKMGSRNSCDILIDLHLRGELDPRKRRQAMKCIEKEVQGGNELALECDALCKLTGYKTKKNEEEAFRLASTHESAGGMWLILGMCHFYGIGTRRSKSKARAALISSNGVLKFASPFIRNNAFGQNPLLLGFLRHFAELDEMVACELLSLCLYQINREESSYAEEGLKWTRRAADKGSMHCQFQYAWMNEYRRFGDINMQKAYHYHRMAAKQGHRGSQLSVARLLIDGTVVIQDLNKAKYYLKQVESSGIDIYIQEAKKLRKLIK